MLDLQIHTEDALLANLLYSETARTVARDMGLEAKHFTDASLTSNTRARYFRAIMAAPAAGYIAAAQELDKTHRYQPGDTERLLSLVELALSVAPDWERLIEAVKTSWLDREIERLRKGGDYEGIAELLHPTRVALAEDSKKRRDIL